MKKNLIYFLILSSIAGFSQNQIFIIKEDGRLYSRTSSECALSLIGQTGIGFFDIAVTPDGKLWAVDGSLGHVDLYEINPTNASIRFVNTVTGITVANSLVALDNSTLLIAAGYDLYKVNLNDASPSLIGNIGYYGAGDLTWYNNDLYLSCFESLVRIVLNFDSTAIVSVTVVSDTGTFFPACFGLVTASNDQFDSDYLLGFSNAYAYEICPIDGTYHQLCSTGNTYGAAAPRIPARIPSPSSCPQPLGISAFSSQEQNGRVYPNPANKNANLAVVFPHLSNIPTTIKLINIEGLTLYSKTESKSDDSAYQINLETLNLSKGIYLIKVNSSDIQFNSRLIVN